ncbi:hypothetical protein CFR76_05895 [Komagataeibacter swingsii]|uniref:Uncharacterized protein n=1 Tax=Komagataeibacter swingsii TaxID=215220 RepID=A0A2V4R2L7_9PROT|nr:hypothetical protein CFR76_05895 [Komagataeibacter swingsii]
MVFHGPRPDITISLISGPEALLEKLCQEFPYNLQPASIRLQPGLSWPVRMAGATALPMHVIQARRLHHAHGC